MMKLISLTRFVLLTGTFFCVTTTALSFPRTATDVSPPWLIALKAYSIKKIKLISLITEHNTTINFIFRVCACGRMINRF